MPASTPSVEHLSRLFPRLADRAALLYEQDGTFRGLCDALAICVRAVNRSQRWGSSTLGAEYEAQQRRLETELRKRLRKPH